MSEHDSDGLLAEQIAYYRAVAPEYESLALPGWGGPEVITALEHFRPEGEVLELACGPGMWTEILLRYATSVTAVDAAPEMLERARARFGERRGPHAGRADRGRALVDDSSSTIQRRLRDGTAYRAVKVPYHPEALAAELASLGWQCTVTRTSGAFYWGEGTPPVTHRSPA